MYSLGTDKLKNLNYFPVFEHPDLPHHLHLDVHPAAVPEGHPRDRPHRGLLGLPAFHPLRGALLRQEAAALHHHALRILRLQHLLRRPAGGHPLLLAHLRERSPAAPEPADGLDLLGRVSGPDLVVQCRHLGHALHDGLLIAERPFLAVLKINVIDLSLIGEFDLESPLK